eukprot:UN12054
MLSVLCVCVSALLISRIQLDERTDFGAVESRFLLVNF